MPDMRCTVHYPEAADRSNVQIKKEKEEKEVERSITDARTDVK